MKLLKTAALVVLLAATGCKESSQMTVVANAHARPAVEVRHMYSGANIPDSAPRGQVFEY